MSLADLLGQPPQVAKRAHVQETEQAQQVTGFAYWRSPGRSSTRKKGVCAERERRCGMPRRETGRGDIGKLTGVETQRDYPTSRRAFLDTLSAKKDRRKCGSAG